MNDYTEKICPYCKSTFKPGDRIVVCSDCDMPHHQDCWVQNQGCTTFGCFGTIKAADHTESSVTRTYLDFDEIPSTPNNVGNVLCRQCGASNDSTSFFCAHCGNRLLATTPPPVTNQTYTSANTYAQNTDMAALIGKNADYYLSHFQTLQQQNKQTSWNWAAFLIAPYWLIYRKMYAYGAACLGAVFILSIIGSSFLSLLSLAGYIVFGIYANYIYMRHLESKLTQMQALSEPYRSQVCFQNGGVSLGTAIGVAVGYFLLVMLLL